MNTKIMQATSELFIIAVIVIGFFTALSWADNKEKELGISGKSSAAIGERIEK